MNSSSGRINLDNKSISSPLTTLFRKASAHRPSRGSKFQSLSQPQSPLIHTRFRGSVATASSYDTNRFQEEESAIADVRTGDSAPDRPQSPVKSPNLPRSGYQQHHSAEPETHSHPFWSVPVVAIHHSPDDSRTPIQEVNHPPSQLRVESNVSAAHPQTPDEYLQLGIKHHEANRLEESAHCFERSAKEQGGCGVGMLMHGLSLRHGWGCPRNEKSGFHWLKKAAELAVTDLEKGKQGVDAMAVRSELILAIYEVGQSFYQGWGVPKDKKMGVSYFQVAARLGDPDAQQSLAFCLAHGKGCKKDRKEAARWYRAAVAQGGISDVGLAWIYKDKYQ